MKNNKGYTLVELLVTLAVFAIIMAEVGSMMMNSSKLYRNGTYEVELQTEAQQIVQQMEELLIDVNGSVSTNYQPALSSDFITISNNDAVYNFELVMDPTLGYGTLYFNKTLSDNTVVASDVPMAEYVQSISLNMDQYTTADVVTLNVSMNNGRYGYQASQDIYLRNGVGTGRGGGYNDDAEYKAELVVLRYKEYDLDDIVVGKPGETFTYRWDDSDPQKLSDAQTDYWLVGDTLQLSSTNNQEIKWNTEFGPYKLIATGDAGSVINIRIRTDKVGYGSNNHAIYFQNVSSTFDTMTPVPVYGIDVSAADDMTVKMVYDDGSGLIEVPIMDGDDPVATYYFFSEAPGARIEMKFTDVSFAGNANDNTIEVTSWYMLDNQIINHNAGGLPGYYEYLRVSGKTIKFVVTLTYPGGDEKEIDIHMMPAPNDSYPPMNSVDSAVENAFWEAVGL